jgi:hypothetical protein
MSERASGESAPNDGDPNKGARVPRPFDLHWGRGQIVEEARFTSEHAQPAIQLLRFETGPEAGKQSLRFCYFNTRGQFQRSPMMVAEDDLERLRAAVARSPEIRRLLRYIAGEGD